MQTKDCSFFVASISILSAKRRELVDLSFNKNLSRETTRIILPSRMSIEVVWVENPKRTSADQSLRDELNQKLIEQNLI